jgi:drug/metabolite transporter (DMT)-like permease
MAVQIGILFAVVTLLSWGAADFFAKKGIDKVGHTTALLLNQAVAIGPIALFALLLYKVPVPTPQIILFVLAAGVLSFLGYFFLYKGLNKGHLSIVSPISASWFVITTLVASVLFGEVLSGMQVLGVAVVFAGIFLASTNLNDFRRHIGKGKSNGILEALLSMLTWGFAFALIKPVVTAEGPVVALLFSRIVGLGALFACIGLTKTKLAFPKGAILLFLVLAGLLDAVGFAGYNIGIDTQYIAIVAPIAAAYPAVTILLARFSLKEKIAKTQQIGVVAILAGLILILLQ